MAKVFSEGTKVTWSAPMFDHKGVIKALHPDDPRYVYVVFNCAGDWNNYKDYDSQRVLVSQCTHGWKDDPDTKSSKVKYVLEEGTWKTS